MNPNCLYMIKMPRSTMNQSFAMYIGRDEQLDSDDSDEWSVFWVERPESNDWIQMTLYNLWVVPVNAQQNSPKTIPMSRKNYD